MNIIRLYLLTIILCFNISCEGNGMPNKCNYSSIYEIKEEERNTYISKLLQPKDSALFLLESNTIILKEERYYEIYNSIDFNKNKPLAYFLLFELTNYVDGATAVSISEKILELFEGDTEFFLFYYETAPEKIQVFILEAISNYYFMEDTERNKVINFFTKVSDSCVDNKKQIEEKLINMIYD